MKLNLKYSLIVLIISEIIFWSIGFGLYFYFSGLEDFKFENKEVLSYLFFARILILLFLGAQF